MKSVYMLLLMWGIGSVLIGQEPPGLVTDRPDQTESSVVVPHKTLQIETGISLGSDKVDGVETQALSVASTLLRLGVLERAELRFGFNYDKVNTSYTGQDSVFKGFDPIEIGTKIYIAEESGVWPELALIAAFTIPGGADDFKTDYLAPALLLAASHTLSESLGLGYNVGAIWDGFSPEAIGKYSAALGWSTSEKIGVFGEIYGEFTKGESAHSLDAGIAYLVMPNLQFDISGGIGLNDNAEDYFISCGLSWRIPK